ncbi:MAG: cell division protein FtsQ/DivIB [Pseudomonadota bacterium]
MRPVNRAGDRRSGGGPGPSKLAYRARRAWAKPAVRAAVLIYLPILTLGIVGWRLVSDDSVRAYAGSQVATLYDSVAARPEFAVTGVEISGGGLGLRAQIRTALGVTAGTSSLHFTVEDLRRRVEALGAVRAASVRLDPKGMLRVAVQERVSVALYRNAGGRLIEIDREGVAVGPIRRRADRPDLPLVIGEGAPEAVEEALALVASAPDIVPRLRAFIRVGERRWDLALTRDISLRLPAGEPAKALARAMALHYGEEVLDRDLAVIDLRVPHRPVLRMTERAAEHHRLRRKLSVQGGEDT